MATRSESDATPPGDGSFHDLTQKYGRYLRGQRGLSENTVRIYLTDLESFRKYLAQERLDPSLMDRQMLRGYLAWLATSARGVRKGDDRKDYDRKGDDRKGYDGKDYDRKDYDRKDYDRKGYDRKGYDRKGYARVSITRKLSALRSFYRFLVQEEWFRSSPVPGRSVLVKVEKHLPAFLSQQEVARLLETPDTSEVLGRRDRAILEVLYACGVRLAEIHGLDLPDINFASREILVRGKGSKERWVLFGKPTEEALLSYLSDSRTRLAAFATPALFLNRYGQRLSRRSFENLVRQYAARAGLRTGVHPHTLRHTFASHMLEGNADLRVIQELLGHSSPTTTQHYTHITKGEARNAYLTYHPRSSG